MGIFKNGGGAAAAAGNSPILVCAYSTAAGQSIPTGTSTIVNFGTQNFDPGTNGTVTTGAAWKFTSNKAQKLLVHAMIRWANPSGTAGYSATIFVNGLPVKILVDTNEVGPTNVVWSFNVMGYVDVANGDYVDFRVTQARGSNLALAPDATENYIEIYQVG